MVQHPDGTWDHPWDENRLSKLEAWRSSCPRCGIGSERPCIKMIPPNEGTIVRVFHPERYYGPVMRMYFWLYRYSWVLTDIPQSSSL